MFNVHWLLLRLAGLFVFEGILVDIEIIILISGFLLLHINLGLQTILNDYIHIKRIKITLLILTRLSNIEVSRYILELIL
uniref:Succinate dehydrogenase subunit 4 n=1 Tax=Melanthalia intermedia TaxID=172989 RepID=A0A345UBP8_9FLOR|nr:succinate dehydrogenase subunit 4 [Melanthalia intermedia]AXI97884.1 succinate dehydrogenase subunit 4 [Melanthalia intermedia]